MKKFYEVYFTLSEPASVIVPANNEDEAEEIFDQLTNKEILERIISALEMGVEIIEIENLNETEE